jgi:tetratricopeptide (TPR) repeat protein
MKRDTRTCLDPETIAAFIDGKLTGPARERVVEHLADCADCYFIFSESARAAAASDGEGADEGRRFPVIEWLKRPKVWSSVAGLAAAAAFVLAAIGPWRPSQPPELRSLVAAVGTARTFEPRLTGGFAYGPVSVVRSGSGVPNVSPDVELAAASIEKEALAHRTPDTVHALGISYLVLGDITRAVPALEEAADRSGADGRTLSDLSAAYLVRAGRSGQAQDVAKALALADRAVKANPKLAEAWFNRAYAMERMLLRAEALEAWQDYLKIDRDSPWAAEANAHIRSLNSQTHWP